MPQIARRRTRLRGNQRRAFLKRLKKVFDERGIEIPYPHMTIYPGQSKDGTAPPLHALVRAA